MLAIYNISTFSKEIPAQKGALHLQISAVTSVGCLQCLKKKDKRAPDSSYLEFSEGAKGRQKAAKTVINPKTAVLLSKTVSSSPLNFLSQMRKITI